MLLVEIFFSVETSLALILTRSQLNTGHALILNFFIQFENSVGFPSAPKPCIFSVLIKRDVLMSEVVLYNIVHVSWPMNGVLINGGVRNSGVVYVCTLLYVAGTDTL